MDRPGGTVPVIREGGRCRAGHSTSVRYSLGQCDVIRMDLPAAWGALRARGGACLFGLGALTARLGALLLARGAFTSRRGAGPARSSAFISKRGAIRSGLGAIQLLRGAGPARRGALVSMGRRG